MLPSVGIWLLLSGTWVIECSFWALGHLVTKGPHGDALRPISRCCYNIIVITGDLNLERFGSRGLPS